MLSLRRFVGAYTEGRLYQVWHFLTHRKKILWGWGGFAKNQVTQVWVTKIIIVLIILLINIKPAFGLDHYKAKHYKQYVFIELNDVDQSYCLIDLYTKENSRWDIKAKNGSHYGIPQGRSEYLKTASGIKQLQWGFKYIGNRYGYTDDGVINACKALDHFKKKGWH
jgi:hypothetical protein